MKQKIIPFIVIIISFLISCKKDILKQNPVYLGVWEQAPGMSCATRITFYENNTALYETFGFSSECFDHFSGEAKANNKTIEINGFKFKIIEPPTPTDTTMVFGDDTLKSYWRMRLKKSFWLSGYEVTLYKKD